MSADGRSVVFSSYGSNLGPPGTLFIRDRHANTTEMLPWQYNDSSRLVVSDDGRHVTFGLQFLDRQLVQTTTVALPAEAAAPNANLTPDRAHAVFVTDRRGWSGNIGGLEGYFGLRIRDLETGGTCGFTAPQPSYTSAPPFIAFSFNGPTTLPLTSRDGAVAVFTSQADYLTSIPAKGIYLFECATNSLSLLNVGANGQPIRGESPSVTSDGGFIAFLSSASATARVDGITLFDRRTRTRERVFSLPAGLHSLGSLAMSDDAEGYAFIAYTDSLPTDPVARGVFHFNRRTGVLRRVDATPGGVPAGGLSGLGPIAVESGRFVAFHSADGSLVPGDTNAVTDVFVRDLFDDDGDTMTNDWETFFGLNPSSAADAALDPDGDGKTNAQEFEEGSHPHGVASSTRYFAEGASTDFFDTRIAVANPSPSSPASVLLRFVKSDGTFATQLIALPPLRSHQLLVDTLPAVAGSSFATVVETDVPVVADRLMWWGPSGAYGTHAERSMGGAALTWHFAEGATHSGFELFYLVLNANATPASVRVRYLLPGGAPFERTYTVPGNSRFSIWVDQERFGGVAALANTDVSAVFEVQNGVPVMVERAMYLTPPGGLTFTGGHATAGATSPNDTWYFAEGATGSYFDEYVLIANPGASAASVRATYLLDSGVTYQKTYTVPAGSRFNIWVDDEVISGQGKVLADVALSIRLDVLSGPPVVAERSMWWPGPSSATWLEAHNVPGATSTAVRWGFAEGAVSTAPGNADTYFLIANATTAAATVRVTLLFNDGTPAVSRTYSVGPTSRFNVHVRAQFPEALEKLFGAIVESIDPAPVPIVVERAVYNDESGVHWAAGTAALGTALP